MEENQGRVRITSPTDVSYELSCGPGLMQQCRTLLRCFEAEVQELQGCLQGM